MPAPSPSDLPAGADTVIIVARPRLALWCAQLDYLRVIELRTRRSMDEFLETI
jgi:hypothetical protein